MIWILIYVAIFLLSLWVIFNTFLEIPQPIAAKKQPIPDFMYANHPEVAERFAKALTFRTISGGNNELNTEEVAKMLEFLKEQYPLLHGGHELVTYEVISTYTHLYKIQGYDRHLKAYLLNAHTDVVPAENQQWSSDPFNTGIKDGWIIGRGAVDMKNGVMAIMEALSYLLKNGFKPRRTLYVAICHDEELHGYKGAKVIADMLEAQKVRLEFVHDEGTVIFQKLVPGMRKAVALVGISEKGYVDVEISLNVGGEAGHSAAQKPRVGVLGSLGAVAYEAEHRRFPLHLNAATVEMMSILSTEMPLLGRIILRNIRLFWPIVSFFVKRTVLVNLFRTTSAVTMFHGGGKPNVIPSQGSLIINHRIHPDDTIAKIVEYDKALLTDPHMEIKTFRPTDPQPIAPFDANAVGYHCVKAAIEQSIGPHEVIVVPGLMIAATDSRHYSRLTEACYRFLPTRLAVSDAHRFHGRDEKISIQNYEETINFYVNLMRNAENCCADEIYK